MTESTPADLAVAFRSFVRREREALDAAEGDTEKLAAARPLTDELRSLVREAAHVVGAGGAPGDLASMGDAVAERIEAIPADAWDDDRLARLRTLALDCGALLRRIEALTSG